IFYVLDSDQRIYAYDLATAQSRALTPAGNYRYADFCFDAQRQRLIAVREDCAQDSHNPRGDIIAIDLTNLTISSLAQGADFYANPRLSPAGDQFSYLRWNHPNMPWDGSECVLSQVSTSGALEQSRVIAGGANESIFQPQWSPTGELFFVSDRTNWWNIYRWTGAQAEAVCELDVEFATP